MTIIPFSAIYLRMILCNSLLVYSYYLLVHDSLVYFFVNLALLFGKISSCQNWRMEYTNAASHFLYHSLNIRQRISSYLCHCFRTLLFVWWMNKSSDFDSRVKTGSTCQQPLGKSMYLMVKFWLEGRWAPETLLFVTITMGLGLD